MARNERRRQQLQQATLGAGNGVVLHRYKAQSSSSSEEEEGFRNGSRSSDHPPPSSLTTANHVDSPAVGVAMIMKQLVGHPLPCFFALCVLLFMKVEYTLVMVPYSSPPLDIGFHLTLPLNRFLAARPDLNSALAALNTVFVLMQTIYILWCLVVEWRPRATIAAAFMFTSRGILGYCTQLPLPQEFLGSGMDFPVGNVSFFLFFSGHVAAAVIASIDMKRVGRKEMALGFDVLNALQVLRLLVTRGHYTIDLAVGVGAGVLFDHLAGRYLDNQKCQLPNSRTRRKTPTANDPLDSSCDTTKPCTN